jgi:hypothetical protein
MGRVSGARAGCVAGSLGERTELPCAGPVEVPADQCARGIASKYEWIIDDSIKFGSILWGGRCS